MHLLTLLDPNTRRRLARFGKIKRAKILRSLAKPSERSCVCKGMLTPANVLVSLIAIDYLAPTSKL